MASNKKIFLDTDIGDDIDDALALVFLLKLKADIVGISTVFKNTNLRARLAKKILLKMGRDDIPVYQGYGKPLAYSVDEGASFSQFEKDLEAEQYAPKNTPEEAIDQIINACYAYGKELTVIAIGPYTNLAKAIEKDKKAFAGIDKIVLMGGCFFEQFVEYNAAMDPEAADILMRSGLNIRFISADVTWQAMLSDEQTEKVLSYHSDSINGYCAELTRLWKKNCWFNPVLHDPLAVYYALDESICKMKQVWAEIELHGSITRGFTANRDHFLKYLENPLEGKDRLWVSYSVDAERFNEIFVNIMFDE